MSSGAVGSVVVPAHDEASVITSCLDALFTGVSPGQLEVVVSCNGCSDNTASVVRALPYPVTVLEQATASKPAALRLADSVSSTLPRLYLDADVQLQGRSALAVLFVLQDNGPLAARPRAHYDTSRASWPVRSYYRARAGLPSINGSLWGAGVYGLSRRGRERFDQFPDVVADDLFVDSLFRDDEIDVVDCTPVVVQVPHTTADLLRVLRRSQRGKAEAHGGGGAGRSSTAVTVAEVRRLASRAPRSTADAAVFAALGAWARIGSARSPDAPWERDASSREA